MKLQTNNTIFVNERQAKKTVIAIITVIILKE